MTREQKLEAALRFVHDDSGFRDLETHTLVAVLNALATPTDADTRVVTVDQLERFRSVSLSGLVSREISEIIGDVKP